MRCHIGRYRYDHPPMQASTGSTSALHDGPFALPGAPADTDLVAKYFRALGEPTRLRMLELLAEEELSVGELVRRVGRPQPRVSEHLACLRWCGFVKSRREHRTIYYRAADARVASVIATGRALLEDNAEHVALCRRIDAQGC
jgi:DNA-binding transcriptional ArsR family regulator